MESEIYLEVYRMMLNRGGDPRYGPAVMMDYMASFAKKFNTMSGRERYLEMKMTIEDFADQPGVNSREVLGLVNLLRWMIVKKQLKDVLSEIASLGKGLNRIFNYRRS